MLSLPFNSLFPLHPFSSLRPLLHFSLKALGSYIGLFLSVQMALVAQCSPLSFVVTSILGAALGGFVGSEVAKEAEKRSSFNPAGLFPAYFSLPSSLTDGRNPPYPLSAGIDMSPTYLPRYRPEPPSAPLYDASVETSRYLPITSSEEEDRRTSSNTFLGYPSLTSLRNS